MISEGERRVLTERFRALQFRKGLTEDEMSRIRMVTSDACWDYFVAGYLAAKGETFE